MKTIVSEVRKKISGKCLVQTCRTAGCRLSLQNVPRPYLIIDFDEPESPLGKAEERCDYLLLADNNRQGHWVVPLEFKKGRVDASKVIKQIKAGINVAEQLIPRKSPIVFQPVVVHGSIHRQELNKLKDKKNKVRFREHRRTIRLIKCGGKLPAELN